MLTELPFELVGEIAEWLHPRDWHTSEQWPAKSDLKSLSLVCRRFRQTAQSHLFRDVVYSFRCAPVDAQWTSVADGSLTQPWNSAWEERVAYSLRTLKMLDTFLQDHPLFGHTMRRLRLVAYPEHNEDIVESDYGDVIDFRDTDGTEVVLLLHLLASLPILEELELADIMLLSSQGHWASRTTPLLSLKRLLVQYPYRSPQSDCRVTGILGCFDTIDEVAVFNSDLAELPSESYSPCSVRIHSLTLLDDTRTSGELFRFLLRSPSTYTLRSLDTAFVAPSTSAPIELARLLEAVAPHLEHFACSLTPRWARHDSHGFSLTDLSACASLRSLTLRVYIGTAPSADTAWERCTQTLLSSRDCARLQTVTVEFHARRGSLDWCSGSDQSMQKLEDVVLDIACRRIFAFSISIKSTLTMPVSFAEEMLFERFPRLAAKQLIQVQIL